MKTLPKTLATLALICFAAVAFLGQSSVQEFQNVLRDKAAYTADDFAAIERGEVVVKVFPVSDRREVAVCGVVRTQTAAEKSLKAFHASMTQQSQGPIPVVGKFSDPPVIEDLQALTLENRDLNDLKQCAVGKCKLKMSAAMIERFRSEVDWGAADYRLQANRLFRQMLVDYVRDYLVRGDSGLIEYQDRIRGVRLDEEQHSLLAASLYINDFAPELTQYLNEFPRGELTGVENSINWTKIKFGLKPVVLITHVVTYRRRNPGTAQIVEVAKQIYASHYFDSSLAVTAVIELPGNGAAPDGYVFYTNRSRADALAGAFSKLKRKLVEVEAVDNLEDLLSQTRVNLDDPSLRTQTGPAPPSRSQQVLQWLLGRRLLVVLLIMVVLLLGLFLVSKRHSKRSPAGYERDH